MGNKADLEIPAARRHIIERPRLTRLLDETSARVIMLVAPAGYGKTTLARQWLATRPHAWYQANRASGDVAALALGLIDSARSVIPAPGEELRAWLGTAAEPQREVETVAALLAEDLADWPGDSWLSIDDYHHFTSSGSQEVVDLLLGLTGFPILIASRTRPVWATPRRLLYGELAELGQHALAMNLQEAADVLDRGDTDAARALIGLANGWPAVIGLASFADLSAILEQDGLPLDLHDYVAEELYAVLAEDVQIDLSRLALLPNLSDSLIEGLLDNGNRILAEGQKAGFLIATGPSALDLHPLLRSFLIEKFQTLDEELVDSTVHDVIRLLMNAHYWEEAFASLCHFNRLELLDELVAQALDELVEDGRIETLKTWVDFGRSAKLESPALELLEAEYCFRAGRHDRAKIFAMRAAKDIAPNSALASRAFYRAGQNAHLTDSPEEALHYFERARKTAQTPAEMQNGLWGEFVTAVELERESAGDALREFEASCSGTLDELVRTHSGRLYLATRQGGLLEAIDQARPLAELVEEARDPVVRVSFLHIYSAALRLSTNYDDAGALVARGLREAEIYHLDFARPHMLLTRAAVHMGLGEFARASRVLDRVDELSTRNDDDYLDMSTAGTRCRLLLAEGAFEKALAATEHSWPGVQARGQRAEFLASRALALMYAGDSSRARILLAEAEQLSRELEPATLCDWVRVLFMFRQDEAQGEDLAREAYAKTSNSGLTDTLVFAYRTDPRVLRAIVAGGIDPEEVASILMRANDRSRARAVGIQLPQAPLSPRDQLTARERDVFELICEGRTNKEIATALFLSVVTVKVHVRNILRKLGVRTRTEAAVAGARRRVP
jgi:LuxR family maltose regulon positive regulatory protein